MYKTFLQVQFQRTYDALLAAPVDVDEIVTRGDPVDRRCAPACTATRRCSWRSRSGCDPKPTALLVPFICFVTGFGFVALRRARSRRWRKSIDNFNYITSGGADADVPRRPARSSRSRRFPPVMRALAQRQPAVPLRAARARRVVLGDLAARPTSATSALLLGVRAADVAAGDLAAAQAADRLTHGRDRSWLLRRRRLAVCVARGGAGGARRAAASSRCGSRCCWGRCSRRAGPARGR